MASEGDPGSCFPPESPNEQFCKDYSGLTKQDMGNKRVASLLRMTCDVPARATVKADRHAAVEF